MMSSEQLERQTEQSRAEVEQTLGELRARLTPGQLVDEILAYAKDGGTNFMRNLGKQVVQNPIPAALIGAGVASLLLGKPGNGHARMDDSDRYNANWDMERGSEPHSTGSRIGEGIGNIAHKAEDAVESAAGSVRDMAQSAGSKLKGTARSVGDSARSLGDSASSAYHSATATVRDTASSIGESATALEQKGVAAARDLMQMMKDQPLILVGVGLAIGAALGAAVPNTEVENRLMGEKADELKREAKDIATEQLGKAKDTAQRLIEENINQPRTNGGGQEGDMQGRFG